jgi:hypothetical protein
MEVPADILNHFWIQVAVHFWNRRTAVSEVKKVVT